MNQQQQQKAQEAKATARDYMAAMDRERRASDTLATAQAGLERANREVDVFRKKLLDLLADESDPILFLVGQKLVQVFGTRKQVLVLEPTVVDMDGRR